MAEWLDILDRIAIGENAETEFKRELGNFAAIGKTICAFANTKGGILVLGVNDAQEILGVKGDPERVQERLTSFLQNGCNSPVSARITRHEDPRGWIHWVEVLRQRGFEPMRYGGQVWIRRGRSSVEPSPSELQELYNIFGYILTEQRAIQDATVGDISPDAFRAYLERQGFDIVDELQPDLDDDLYNGGVLVDNGGALHASLYGVLAFGKYPQRYPQTRNFRIECVAYAGEDRASDVLQVASVTGRIDEQVQKALGWFGSLGRFEAYHDLHREDRYMLPRSALREALVNAVSHRDYSIMGSKVMLEVFDRHVDVSSPGTLPNHMTVEAALTGINPRSRNQSLAHYMAVMGYMEQRGRGWPIMRKAMREFNGTDPELFQSVPNKYVKVAFRMG